MGYEESFERLAFDHKNSKCHRLSLWSYRSKSRMAFVNFFGHDLSEFSEDTRGLPTALGDGRVFYAICIVLGGYTHS